MTGDDLSGSWPMSMNNASTKRILEIACELFMLWSVLASARWYCGTYIHHGLVLLGIVHIVYFH